MVFINEAYYPLLMPPFPNRNISNVLGQTARHLQDWNVSFNNFQNKG